MAYDIIQTDHVRCAADWRWESILNGWSGYHLWYVTGGSATIQKSEMTFQLSPGDSFCFDLSENHICTHDPENPLCVETIYWHASHPVSLVLFHSIGNTALGRAIQQCVRLHKNGNPQAHLWLAAAVSEFTHPENLLIGDAYELKTDLIGELSEWINIHSDEPLSLQALSQKAGYSKNHLIRLFKKKTSLTPYQYYLKCRINKSISLLLYTNLPITVIACNVGFEDAAHFSKTFKNITGQSPKQLRCQAP